MGLYTRTLMACGVVLGLGSLGLGCTPKQGQTETCLARTDEAMVVEAQARCHGYTWAECPLRQEIIDKYSGERHRCP